MTQDDWIWPRMKYQGSGGHRGWQGVQPTPFFRHICGDGWGRKITKLKIYWVKVPWVKNGRLWTSRGWEIDFFGRNISMFDCSDTQIYSAALWLLSKKICMIWCILGPISPAVLPSSPPKTWSNSLRAWTEQQQRFTIETRESRLKSFAQQLRGVRRDVLSRATSKF